MIPTPYTVEVLPFEPGAVDAHGNPVRAWGDPVEHAVHGWARGGGGQSMVATVEPYLSGHDRVVVDLQVFAPESVVVGPDDRMVVAGKTYDVVGERDDWNHSPWGWRPGFVINLRRVDG